MTADRTVGIVPSPILTDENAGIVFRSLRQVQSDFLRDTVLQGQRFQGSVPLVVIAPEQLVHGHLEWTRQSPEHFEAIFRILQHLSIDRHRKEASIVRHHSSPHIEYSPTLGQQSNGAGTHG